MFTSPPSGEVVPTAARILASPRHAGAADPRASARHRPGRVRCAEPDFAPRATFCR